MNGWRRVERADLIPQKCAVFPQLGAAPNGGLIDTGMEIPCIDPRTYISVEAARELGKFVGLVEPGEVERKVVEVQQLEAELAEAKARIESLEAQIGAVDVLVSADFRARSKPGRPKKSEVKEAA